MNRVGQWQTTDDMEEQFLQRFPFSSPPLPPQLEFGLFAQLSQNLLQQEVHASLSAPSERVYKERKTCSKQTLTPLEVV